MGIIVTAVVAVISNSTLRGVIIPFLADVMIAVFAKSKTDPVFKAKLDEVFKMKAEAQTTEELRKVAVRLNEL